MEKRLLAAAALLCLVDVLHVFAVEEKDNELQEPDCPAFLMFDNAAYLADMTFELPCYCKPKAVSSVVWYFQKNADNPETIVLRDLANTSIVDSSHIRAGSDVLHRFRIRLFSLIVFRAQVADSGHYLCGTDKGDFFYGYDVDVQPTQQVSVAFLDRGQRIRDDYTEKLFTLFTTFWNWTMCDRCGVRGEQRRIGLCYVQSALLSPRYRTAVTNVTSCGSRAVPAHLQPLIRLHAPEVAIRRCRSLCLNLEMSKEGLQAISNIISQVGDKPWQPRVPTQFHKQLIGTDLVIACPGARPEHAVAWDKGFLQLYRSRYLIGVNKTMRIFIDHGNHLHIQRVRARDRGTYYCWREGKLVAGFRLSVTYSQKRPRNLDDPETIYAVKVIGLSYCIMAFLFILIHVCRYCWRALRGSAKV